MGRTQWFMTIHVRVEAMGLRNRGKHVKMAFSRR